MLFAFILFIFAVAGIVGLFIVKHYEVREGRALFLPEQRAALSEQLDAYEVIIAREATWVNISTIAANIALTTAHFFARMTARLAKWVEWRARHIAHKSAVAKQAVEEVRENVYLKEVCDHKECLDTTEVAEANKL